MSTTSAKSSHHYFVLEPENNIQELDDYENAVSSPRIVWNRAASNETIIIFSDKDTCNVSLSCRADRYQVMNTVVYSEVLYTWVLGE